MGEREIGESNDLTKTIVVTKTDTIEGKKVDPT